MEDIKLWRPLWERGALRDWTKELGHMRHEMDRFFHREEAPEGSLVRFWPATDISESPEGWRLRVDLPGVEDSDVQLSVHNDVLTIQGERKQETTEQGENYVRTERSYGSFERDFTLPSGADDQKIAANFRNGTLEVFIPKAPEVKEKEQVRTIPIQGK